MSGKILIDFDKISKYWWVLVIAIFVGIGILVHKNIKKVYVKYTVLSHQSGADKLGTMHYFTVMECEDGYVRSFEGLSWFTMEIGSKGIYEEYQWK
jgi:hypothetical protein